ncbi:MAG: hypothetical protein K0R82_2332 [Flavipsychrobacter sp.]|jgi:uncharacterized membrane protein YcaP (DUF421 family)|nr:hypothetical protein [Flavipsychrobacter sp.]
MHTLLLQAQNGFDVHSLLWGEENFAFLGEVALRAIVMFIVVLVSLRILGKRGVKQLSVFELVIILSLGSAGGDAIFYRDVGLVVCIMVFVMIVILYRLVIYIADKSHGFNKLVEGVPVLLLEGGQFDTENFKHELISLDEFFSELRRKNVSQLGQVYKVYGETTGELSVFYYRDEDVKYGLPIFPELLEKPLTAIDHPGIYACTNCAHTQEIKPAGEFQCPDCKGNKWLPASNQKRIT